MELVAQLEVLRHELDAVALHHDPEHPVGVVGPGHDGHQEQPEPQHEEHLLVEQVDGQHTLDRVTL